MTRPARVVINLSALNHNLQRVREIAPGSKVMAIVKADAYGHGLARVAHALTTVDAFGVACLEEARELRESGIEHPIILLEGPYTANELIEIDQLGLEIVIHEINQVEMLEQIECSQPILVWLKIDTGMHRLGFLPEEVESIWQKLKQCNSVSENIRLMTHLALANERDNSMTTKQLECFQKVCTDLNAEKTIANSAGILAFPESHADWVRPGLMLYGVSPLADSEGGNVGLQAVMKLESKLISVKQLRTGESVGYGASWCCPQDMLVGVVAAGYGDGYPRHAPSGTPVLVNGERVSLIGHASMDMLTVDLRSQPNAKAGDPVELWGDSLPVEEIAQHAGTIPYELLCAVHKRLEFIEHG
jgi:alanine racemase